MHNITLLRRSVILYFTVFPYFDPSLISMSVKGLQKEVLNEMGGGGCTMYILYTDVTKPFKAYFTT
jgi:hypothetical protein